MDDETMEGQAETLAGEARKRVGDMAGKAAPAAEFVYDQARERARGAAAALAGSVEQQPLAVLLAVGLLGVALGFLLGRR